VTELTALPSRKYAAPKEFVTEFLCTLTPCILEAQKETLLASVPFYRELACRVKMGSDFVRELADSLLASDDPLPLIECAFELLGHTGKDFVSREDDFAIVDLARDIAAGNEAKAEYFANLLHDLGFLNILFRNDLEDLLLGVQIGLETHRRKNIGGKVFQQEVYKLLDQTVRALNERGYQTALRKEVTIRYGDGLSKKVDFAIYHREQIRFGVEVNYYTVADSKPTEIKRSYGEVLRGLRSVGVDLIWITDGKGYRDMRQSLKDAFTILPNIYNLRQAKAHLLADLEAALSETR
jgi:hypothetical protein